MGDEGLNTAETGELIRKGKVKEVYDRGEPDRLHFRFSDNISVFDLVIPTTIPRKGECLCRLAAHWFRRCSQKGIRSHFISMPTPTTMDVARVDIITDYSKITPETKNYLIPLELICRHYLAGSMHDRLKRGDVLPESLGFPAGKVPDYGAPFPEPLIESTTKLEPVDRPLTKEEAMDMAGLTEDDYREIEEAVLTIDAEIGDRAAASGLIHVDGKKEFAYDADRNLMVIDTFGTPDEDRFWDAEMHGKGEFVDMSKEVVRQHYRSTGYHEKLMEARRNDQPEPPIPPLSGEMADKVAALYADFFERLTGEKF